MKLILAIVSNDDNNRVMKHLVKEKHFVTKMSSSGGFLKNGNCTLMIGANDEEVHDIIDIISRHSKSRTEMIPNSIANEYGPIIPSMPVEVNVGGATIFVLDVQQFMKI